MTGIDEDEIQDAYDAGYIAACRDGADSSGVPGSAEWLVVWRGRNQKITTTEEMVAFTTAAFESLKPREEIVVLRLETPPNDELTATK